MKDNDVTQHSAHWTKNRHRTRLLSTIYKCCSVDNGYIDFEVNGPSLIGYRRASSVDKALVGIFYNVTCLTHQRTTFKVHVTTFNRWTTFYENKLFVPVQLYVRWQEVPISISYRKHWNRNKLHMIMFFVWNISYAYIT